MPAARIVRLATIDGARALGLDSEIGSVEVGKRADIIVVRIDGPHAEPGGDPCSRLVYACKSSDVQDVIVGGDVLVSNRIPTRLDTEAIVRRARTEAKKLTARV
jgi:5-methylthioadenosine/S-adenosylhomocysteine deaminase